MGGQPANERTAYNIISTFLTESGIGTHRQVIDNELYIKPQIWKFTFELGAE
jgi:hypothetical protein